MTQRRADAPGSTTVEIRADSAVLCAEGYASISVRPSPYRAHVSGPRVLSQRELVHPVLAFVGAVLARWTGRNAFHGASVLLSGRAWVLLAGPSGGKSTLVSELNARDHPVLADDLTVIDDAMVLAGPRSCDLRDEASGALARGHLLDVHVARRRWRETLGPAPHEAPLAGFIALEWSRPATMEVADVRRKLQILAANEALGRGPSRPESFLDLLHLPIVQLGRPRSWGALNDTVQMIEEISAS